SLVERSVTSAPPSGRNAIAQGTSSPFASTDATTLGGWLSSSPPGELVGRGRFGGAPPAESSGGPKAQPPSTVSRAAAVATRRGRRRAFTATSLARPAGAGGPDGSTRRDQALAVSAGVTGSPPAGASAPPPGRSSPAGSASAGSALAGSVLAGSPPA